MGISNWFASEIDDIFNHWAKVNIADKEVKKLEQIAMAPNREVLSNLLEAKKDHRRRA